MGLTSHALPEDCGGGGARSAVTQALMAEELACGDLALALAILSPLLLSLPLADYGSDAQKQRYLPGLAGPDFRPGALAVAEPRFDSDALRPRTRARPEGEGYVLDGVKCLVPWLEGVPCVGVVAQDEDGPQIFLVDAEAEGLRAEPAQYMGLHALPLVELQLESVRLPRSARLGEGAGSDVAAILARGRVGLAALATGVARAAFELARDYAKQRETFGAPIATRQSIAFLLADLATEIDGLRLLTWEAAWRLDRGEDARREAALASQQAQRVVLEAADGAVQIFGGHGYVREYLPELLLRNAGGFAGFEALTLV